MEPVVEKSTLSQTSETSVLPEEKEINIYPMLRSVFLVFCVIIFILAILILLYINGKQVYENGI